MVLPGTIWSFQVVNRVLYLWQPGAPKKVLWSTFFLRVRYKKLPQCIPSSGRDWTWAPSIDSPVCYLSANQPPPITTDDWPLLSISVLSIFCQQHFFFTSFGYMITSLYFVKCSLHLNPIENHKETLFQVPADWNLSQCFAQIIDKSQSYVQDWKFWSWEMINCTIVYPEYIWHETCFRRLWYWFHQPKERKT